MATGTHQQASANEAASRIEYATAQIQLLVVQVRNQAEFLVERDIASLLHIASALEGTQDYLGLVMKTAHF